MDFSDVLYGVSVLAPGLLMAILSITAGLSSLSTAWLWRGFQALSMTAFALTALALWSRPAPLWSGWVATSVFSLCVAALVQGLGTVIGSFSSRYLQGETEQRRYVAMFAAVLACVHVLLLADHWLILMAAWAGVGWALQHLLCFYPERPFARLAALKKRIADRFADVLLCGAAGLAWQEVGSGSLSALWTHIAQQGVGTALHISAVLLVLAVVLRTALFPVHGWLIQVMEAPTPVSAMLHAGVVNLGGFVLIRFASLLEQAAAARGLLLVFGLVTAVLAGMVMLTRITIKVRLAWSTVAQMGFMLLECALGLYTLAALHLIGHSLYKAHAFLSASTVVRQTRLQSLRSQSQPGALSIALAPVLATGIVLGIGAFLNQAAWPWWWSVLLGLAWAPLVWIRQPLSGSRAWSSCLGSLLGGMFMVAGLALAAYAAHLLPLGLQDSPYAIGGPIALVGLAALYISIGLLQTTPQLLERWRRWSYAGFYVDEAYTRWALQWWPMHWVASSAPQKSTISHPMAVAD